MLMLVVQLICGVIKMVPSVTLVHLYCEHNLIVITNPTLYGLWVKCMVLNTTLVGKRLRESDLGYSPSYEAPLER